MEASAEIRIDDLARRAGVPTTTIRLYQRKGLLPGPRLEGRTGYYGPAHLNRLNLIGRLQDEGFSLAGIKRLVDAWEAGHGLAELVGAESGLAALVGQTEEVVVEPSELAEILEGEPLQPETLARATELGLIEPLDNGTFRVPDRRFLELGAALLELGIPADVIVDQWGQLLADTDRVVGRFIDLFEEHLAPEGRDLSEEDLAEAGRVLAELQRLATQTVLTAFETSLSRLGSARIRDELRARLGGPTSS